MPLIDVQLVLSDQSLGARIRVRLDTDEWDLAVVKIAKKLRNAGTPDAIVAGFMGDDGRPAASLRFMTADGAVVTDAEDVMDNECIYALLGGAELPRDGGSGGSGSSGGKGKGKGKGKDKAKAAAKTVFGPSDVVIWRAHVWPRAPLFRWPLPQGQDFTARMASRLCCTRPLVPSHFSGSHGHVAPFDEFAASRKHAGTGHPQPSVQYGENPLHLNSNCTALSAPPAPLAPVAVTLSPGVIPFPFCRSLLAWSSAFERWWTTVICPGSNHLLPLPPRVNRYSRAQPSKADAGPRKSICRGSSWASSCSRRCVPLPRGVRPAAAGTAVRHTSPSTPNSISISISTQRQSVRWLLATSSNLLLACATSSNLRAEVRQCGSKEVI